MRKTQSCLTALGIAIALVAKCEKPAEERIGFRLLCQAIRPSLDASVLNVLAKDRMP